MGGMGGKLLATGLLVVAAPATAQDCRPIDETLRAIAAETIASRADATGRLDCHFPAGLSFNDAARKLEANGFDLLNKTERSFHRWRLPGGEEFVSRRRVSTTRGLAEFRVTVHMQGRRIARFSAQYLLVSR
jgi:hypothetical protein